MPKKIKPILAALLTFILAVPALAETVTLTQNERGTYDGFDCELWTQNKSDAVSMTLTGGGTFECSWDAENILFRTGKKLGSKMNYDEYGNVTMEYAATWDITKGNVNYLCVYGWTEDPMIEFYIIEARGGYKPGSDFIGTYEIDGSTYQLYTNTRIEQPSIQGKKTFEQYFGIRVDKRTEGTISISEHFKAWDDMGLDMSGKMYEVSLCVEGYNSAGTANVYGHQLTVGDTVYGFIEEREGPEPTVVPSTPAPAETTAPTPQAPIPTPVPPASKPPIPEPEFSNIPIILALIATAFILVGTTYSAVKKYSVKPKK